MMESHRSTTSKLPRPLPLHSLAQRGATQRDAPGPRYRLGARRFTVSTPNPSIARKPAWMLDFALEIYRQPENRPDGKSPPGTQRDVFTVRITVRLKGIPAIDLDRSRQTSR